MTLVRHYQIEFSSSALLTTLSRPPGHFSGRLMTSGQRRQAERGAGNIPAEKYSPVSQHTELGRWKRWAKTQCNSLSRTQKPWCLYFSRNGKIQIALLVSDFKQSPPWNWHKYEIVIRWRDSKGVVWLGLTFLSWTNSKGYQRQQSQLGKRQIPYIRNP